MLKRNLSIGFLIVLIGLVGFACGGSGGGDIPNVAGTYQCTSGCDGVCIFDGTLTVVQDEGDVILQADSGDSTGTVDDEGDFSTVSDNGTCEGQFVQGVAIANCFIQDTQCQQVTYTR